MIVWEVLFDVLTGGTRSRSTPTLRRPWNPCEIGGIWEGYGYRNYGDR